MEHKDCRQQKTSFINFLAGLCIDLEINWETKRQVSLNQISKESAGKKIYIYIYKALSLPLSQEASGGKTKVTLTKIEKCSLNFNERSCIWNPNIMHTYSRERCNPQPVL